MRSRTVAQQEQIIADGGTVTEDAFRRDPAHWLRQARKNGPIAIVDKEGRVRATISVPGKRLS